MVLAHYADLMLQDVMLPRDMFIMGVAAHSLEHPVMTLGSDYFIIEQLPAARSTQDYEFSNVVD